MGAPTESRKRQLLPAPHPNAALTSDDPSPSPPDFKKPKLLSSPPPPTPDTTPSPAIQVDGLPLPSKMVAPTPPNAAPQLRSLPAPPLPRAVHGPQRNLNFFGLGSSSSSRSRASEQGRTGVFREFGGFSVDRVSRPKRPNSGTPLLLGSSKRRRVGRYYDSDGVGNDGRLGLEEYRRLVNSRQIRRDEVVVSARAELSESIEAEPGLVVVAEEVKNVVDLAVEDEKFEDAEMTGAPVDEENEFDRKQPVYIDLLEQSNKRDSRLRILGLDLKLLEMRLSIIRAAYPVKEDKPEEVINEAFLPLTEEEEAEVVHALHGRNMREVLVTHEASNIVITREVMKCLCASAWLNDEVINVYLELLKERERREPKKFLKCHFFNTFFFKKLTSGRGGYDFKSVRRWTTQRKLGYGLIECDKIFIPIHKDIHWCLAIIDVKEKRFLYLDSLGGVDTAVVEVLARYFMEEVKDKSNKDIDTSSWTQEGVAGLPLQKNGWDCGMFMLKYTDFYSRGSSLCFNQDNMPYFRMRTVKELLRLRAE